MSRKEIPTNLSTLQHDTEHLTDLIDKGGRKVWTKYLGRSSSGLTRYYDAYVVIGTEICRITYTAAAVCMLRYSKSRESIAIHGYGFSAAQEIAESIGYALYKDANSVAYREF